MKKFFIITYILLTELLVHAQKKVDKIHFTSINGISLISGENSNNIGIQSVNGIRFRQNWIIGLGVAYDTYQVPSVPVFMELRKYLGQKKIIPFLYADAGRNITLHNSNYPSSNTFETYHFTPAYYLEAGIGMSRTFTRKTTLFLSAGYSSKQFNYDMTSKFNYSYPPWGNSIFHYDYTFQRLNIKLGIEF